MNRTYPFPKMSPDPALGHHLLPLKGYEANPMLDVLASASQNLERCTITIVNKDLHRDQVVLLPPDIRRSYRVQQADMIAPAAVRAQNTFDEPDAITDRPLQLQVDAPIDIPKHSIVRLAFERG